MKKYSARPLRIAFLTPEFVSENSGIGGLASYIYRMAKALKSMGHESEVFVPIIGGNKKPGAFIYEGIRVERVQLCENIPFRFIRRLRLDRYSRMNQTVFLLRLALGIAKAVAKREKEKPFDFIHSSDCGNPGLFVKKSRQRPLVVRCSWARELWLKADGTPDVLDVRCANLLERILFRRAEVVYAPSRFVANYYSRRYGFKVETLRPPFVMDAEPADDLPWELPERFLIHFGTLGPIKGTDVLADALPIVWNEEPEFTMVWAGQGRLWTERGLERRPNLFAEYSHTWGKHASRVIWLGEIKKPLLYAVIKQADAAVLPSCCDNLPNTAIESLSLGIPVIGTHGSSIDELIEPGLNGELVPIGDPAALASIMVRVWRREVSWLNSTFCSPAILKELDPEVSASGLIRLAGFGQ